MHFCQLTSFMGKSGGKPLTLTPGICIAWVSFICSEVACSVLHLYLLLPHLILYYYSSTCVFLQIQNKLHACESCSQDLLLGKKMGRGEMSYYWLSFRHNHWLRLCLVPIHHIIFINENFTEAGCTKCSSSHPSQLVLTQVLTITLG